MANPNIIATPLNRLLVSVTWVDFPALNVTPSFLMPEGVDLTFEGQATTMLPSMTDAVTSPEPYQLVRMMMHLVRTSNLAQAYETQRLSNTLLGGCTLRSDALNLKYAFDNCTLMNVDRLPMSGRDAGYVVTVAGVYQINSTLWN